MNYSVEAETQTQNNVIKKSQNLDNNFHAPDKKTTLYTKFVKVFA